MFTSMCILTSLVAQSVGLVIGCACDIQTAVYMGPITTIPILLFSGIKHERVKLSFSGMPIAWKA